jgi:hypothetical protein
MRISAVSKAGLKEWKCILIELRRIIDLEVGRTIIGISRDDELSVKLTALRMLSGSEGVYELGSSII